MAKKSNSKSQAVKRAAREVEERAKKHPKIILIIALILLIAILVGAVCWYFLIYKKNEEAPQEPSDGTEQTNPNDPSDPSDPSNPSTPSNPSNPNEGNLADISSADLSIHFLELGVHNAGDCVLIKAGDTEVLIDAGAKAATAPTQAMLDYVASYCTDGVLEYVVATHAHEDHIAGLVGAGKGTSREGFLYRYQIGTIIQFSKHQTSSNIYQRYEAAVEYCKSEYGTKVYTALDCTSKTNGAQTTYYLDEAQTISMNILYQEYYEKNSKENNYSVCMLLTQKLESTENNYLFTGDLEKAGEESLVKNNPDLPHCMLFKGGHHGSSTSSNEALLEKITPDNIAICTCAGTYEYADKPTAEKPDTYLNTFPTQEAIDRMSRYTQNIYVTTLGIVGGADKNYATEGFTSMNGNIVFYYGKGEEESEKSLKLWCSNNTTILKETAWFKENRTWSGV